MASEMGWGGGCTEQESPGGRSGGWKLGESLEFCWEPLSQGPSCPQPMRTSPADAGTQGNRKWRPKR